MKKEDQRLMLAGHALQGLLATQSPDKPWNMGLLAVLSLKVADTVLYFDAQPELPELTSEKSQEEPSNIITPPSIITPRE